MKHIIIILAILLIVPTCVNCENKPNFLVIITDDQNYGTVTQKWMPNTKKEIFDAGISFNRAYISNPLCCPSRASIFTGLYSKNNGQLTNKPIHNLNIDTCGHELILNGYTTGLIGKYLNSHTKGYQEFQKRQFNIWHEVNKRGYYSTHDGKTGRIDTKKLDEFVKDNTIKTLNDLGNTPFLLFTTFHYPHGKAPVDESFDDSFKKMENNESATILPNYLKRDYNKPKWVSDSFLNHYSRRKQQISYNKLQILDIYIKEILDTLKKNNQFENTYIIFISDNGYLNGQHGINGKSVPYEDAIRVPMAIRGPGIKPSIRNDIVSNIDIAPTIYSLANISTTDLLLDGIDILTHKREHLFLQGAYFLQNKRRKNQNPFVGIVYKNFRLFKTENDKNELYDIKKDPYQLNNIWNVDKSTKRKLLNMLENETN